MTEQEAIERIKIEQENYDTKVAHSNADEILCEFLTSLGYTDLVNEYHKVQKWFA